MGMRLRCIKPVAVAGTSNWSRTGSSDRRSGVMEVNVLWKVRCWRYQIHSAAGLSGPVSWASFKEKSAPSVRLRARGEPLPRASSQVAARRVRDQSGPRFWRTPASHHWVRLLASVSTGPRCGLRITG